MNEKNLLILSIKDFLTPKMLKYSIAPFVVTAIVMYLLFFTFAGMGLEHLTELNVHTTQTTIQDGIPHTESFSAQLEGSAIIQFLMKYTLTSWIASFLVYVVGGFFVLYISVFIAVIIIGFLTPLIIKELQKRHYRDIELIGHSNLISSIFLSLKWLAVMIMLYFLLIPFYFIPLLNIIAFNLPLYYFFHNMLTHDISTNICTKEEDKHLRFFAKNEFRIKTLLLYLISLIPFAIFFGAVFYVIYLGHTYFKEVKKLRD